ncbi:MAG: hypothetical protein NT094_00065, partial [Candidatus Staskawiczbacteria bacterium]|nr:hypothetical protein [Candidatus Staskawiczbacteria bacterium]
MDMSVLHKRVDTRITIAILSLEVFAALLSLVLIVYPNMNVKASSTITASSIIVVFRNDPGIQNSSATSQLLGSPKVVTKFSSINNLNKKYNTQSFRQMFVQVQYFNTVYELVVNTTDVSITVQDFKKDLNVEYARISEPNFEQKIKNEIDTTNQNIVKQNLHWTAGYTVPEIMTDQDRMKLVGAILPAGLSLQTSENSNQTKAFLAGISGCVPVCFGKKCGDPDGCGGFCQTCPSGQVCTGTGCCTLNCSGRTCGGDGCGGSCGSCAPGQVCYENMGGSRNCCTPNCSGKICGDNGCGGSCGQCSVGNICNSYGQCVIQRSPLPSTFDWRNINGRNYITPVKDQHYCGSCAVFATIGSLEGEVNAYYNNPSINLDLSEQDLVSCSGAGSCSTGFSVTLPYIRSIGVTDEACFPYTSKDSSCSEKCSTWQSNV